MELTPEDRERAELIARLSHHEFMLQQLWAKVFMNASDPIAACEEARQEFLAAPPRAKPSPDLEFVRAYTEALSRIQTEFFAGIARVLTVELGKAPRRP